jgi:hypothetical protein
MKKNRPVREKYSHKIADEKKRQKRKESDERMAARATRTDEEQLAKLDTGNWRALRERDRLHKRIAKSNRVVVIATQKKKKKKGSK